MNERATTKGATVHRLEDAVPAHIAPRLRDHTSIAAVERRRTHLWVVAALLLLGLSGAVVLLFLGTPGDALVPEVPALRWSFLALSVAFIIYAVDQERRLRGLTTLLVEERVLTSSLQARISDLTTLTKVGRVVNSVLTLEEVLEVVLNSAFELTGASSGSVMLLEHGRLRVAASAGERAAPVGAVVEMGSGVAGWVASAREPVLINGKLASGQFPGVGRRRRSGGSSVVAPLVAGEDVLGVLAVERASGGPPFSDAQLRSVAVFAEHGATAVHNAHRYGRERSLVQELADSLERRADFVATMVHELKTPLTVILGFASVLDERWQELGPDRRSEALSSIRGQGQRLRNLVDEILRCASAEAGAELRRAPVDVEGLVSRVIARMATLSAEREGSARRIEFGHDGGAPTVPGDADALERVFENLLENAIKYSPTGSPIEVAVRVLDGVLEVAITDHGPGIPEDELETVFERFRRRGYTVAGGVGLGLYIVRALVLSHGGQVWADSEVGRGTTFTVALPLRLPAEAELVDARSAAPPGRWSAPLGPGS